MKDATYLLHDCFLAGEGNFLEALWFFRAKKNTSEFLLLETLEKAVVYVRVQM